jgi:hypothetical protein
MRKSLLAALVVVASMAAFASTAAAFPLNVNPGGSITARGLRYNITALGGLVSITCDVTLNGTINRVVNTGAGGAGAITSGSVSNCNYPVTLLLSSTNQWPLTAITALGTAPALTGVLGRIDNAQFFVAGLPLVGDCLVRGAVNFLIPISGGTANSLTTLASTFATSSCGISASDRGGQSYSISPSQTVTR